MGFAFCLKLYIKSFFKLEDHDEMKRTLLPLFLELSFLLKRGTAKGRTSVEDRNYLLSNKTCLESLE
jgi:hypothetical protein